MGQRVLTIVIGGDAKGGQKAMADTEKSAEGVGSKLGGMAAVGGAAFLAIGAAAVGFAVKSADTFARVGGEVLKLQRYTGATAEDASRLRFAGEEAGLGVDDMTKSLGLLSKGLVTTKFDKLGFDFKDASGKAKPLNDDLLKIAARFKDMPNGAEKTALAMQLFGKSGAAMIPFLNRGAEGIRALEKESDKYGNTLNGKDLQAVKDATANHRLFSAAMQGLQIQIGRYVLPIITQFSTFMATNMPTAINGVRSVMQTLAPAFTLIGEVVTHVGTALSGFIERFNLGKPVMIAIGAVVGTLLVGAFGALAVSAGTAAVSMIAAAAPFVAVGLAAAGLVAGVMYAYQNFEVFRDVVNGVITTVQTVVTAGVDAVTILWNTFGQSILNGIQSVWPPIAQIVSGVMETIHGVIQTVTSLIHGDWSGVWNGIKMIFSGVWDEMVGILKLAWAQIQLTISLALDAVRAVMSGAWNGLKSIVSSAWSSITSSVTNGIDGVVNFVRGMPGRIASAAHGMWDGIVAAFKAAMNAVIRAWNDFGIPSFHVHITMPSIIPNIDFDTPRINFPDIPYLASGGIVRQSLGGVLARIGEGSSPEAVLPLTAQGLQPFAEGIVERIRALAGGERTAVASSLRAIEVHLHLEGATITQGVEHLAQVVQQQLEQINLRNYGVGLGLAG